MREMRKILLVEDDADDEALTMRALQKSNLKSEIHVVRDGAAALEYLMGDKELPDVVLLDLKLPKVDGHEVLHRIRSNERTRTLPVIILSSSSEESDLARGYLGGANSYVVKPVDSAKYKECIQQLGQYWLVLNEAAPGKPDET